ncbi:unnamed protein product [Oikopleura dioica]|uniref:Uncharacterized protein n=1 Tax=Oikopleura dioica TaxID=34765 RepID=E4X2Y7_OIKDI|nr:unnamed protein product [Oikopleura dioica]
MKKLPIYLHCWLILCICTTLVMMHLLYAPKTTSPKKFPKPKSQVSNELLGQKHNLGSKTADPVLHEYKKNSDLKSENTLIESLDYIEARAKKMFHNKAELKAYLKEKRALEY